MSGYVVKSNRIVKAQKIEAVLSDFLQKNISGFSVLDIGTGVGEIGTYFSNKNTVVGIDVENQLSDSSKTVEGSNFSFVKVENELLPFKDEFFDIVISNHVIEHVRDQQLHLKQVMRVLKPDGICYFATPNRIFPKEVHTKTYLLHYFPYNLFFLFLKLLNKYQEPVYLLSYWQQQKLFKNSGFAYREYTKEVLDNPQKYNLDETFPFRLPSWMQALSKTNIFILYK